MKQSYFIYNLNLILHGAFENNKMINRLIVLLNQHPSLDRINLDQTRLREISNKEI